MRFRGTLQIYYAMAYYRRRTRARPYRRRFKRRTVYRRRSVRSRRPTRRVNRGASNGFPNKMLVKQVWTYRDTFTTDGDTVIRGNGPYDPQQATGTGQKQPVGWDAYEAIYGSYKCLGSKIQVIFQNNSSIPVKVYLIGNTTTTGLESNAGNDLVVQPCHRSAILSPDGAKQQRMLSLFRKTSYFYSKNDDGLTSSTSSIPSEQFFWHIVKQDGDDIDYYVKVTYYTMFYDRKTYALDS